ncbi:uncharacterized protein LOC112090255 isoform X2 [Morus notabilis]|uniref:uncharacterized protein LOC112090255 isoform X2 n=1 Tax=Morus notabilis TaxID=981085 RepID=UPI000CED1C6F|nr:uncharacterized protein LOC112090255 isoform X2 [Morus notabilis]
MPVTAKGNNQSKLLLYQKQCSNNDTCQWAQKKFGGVSDGSIVHTSIGVKNCQSVKRMNVVKEEPMEIISDPCSQEAIQKLPENAGGSSKLTEGEYFRTISMSVRQDGRASQVAKADMVGQVVTSDGVAHVVKTDEVAKTDTVVQVVKTQVAKTGGVAPVVKADSVVQMVKAEPVNLVGTENGQSAKVMKVVKKEPVENKSAPCSQEIMGKLCGESSGVTKDSLLGSTVPQVAVKTEGIDFDRSFPTFSPWTRVPLVAVKTEVVDLDERSPTFSPLLAIGGESFIELPECLPFPVVRGRADVERKTVYIRDSAKRLWPVNYHEKPGLTVLVSGWAGLSKANRIKSGDQCCFTLEVESDGIYALTVVPK